ncbi:Qc-snare Syn8 Syntaxin8-family [Chlorella sorokiniana]|jgi:SYP5 family syntaxin|uniref:Qc-snare Syn8 Syntaxin8-family n=1 Tax=Chlorella sorokiniana TaxID=3076 RepID=A0A2P6TQS4_CHLSO|nr:Qc-snare Syn8 Syntaxin8-family [Chlorella sorokiniana]|eukprot:PRW56426.1 Qc-snare Syn8 Syntaxin8-family [Chlorella sorokiniana]
MAEAWLADYEAAKQTAAETLQLIQERNLKFPEGGPEASRLTATARRKLGTLGSLLDGLRASLEGPEQAGLTENERNRRRDLVAGLRTQREKMQASLKREAPRAAREALLGGSGSSSAAAGSGQETDTTAELNNAGLLQLQQQVMSQQDAALESLERTVVGTKHIALQINEEAELHNRLLDDLDEQVDGTRSRLAAAQRRLKLVMRRSGSCKTMTLMFLIAVILVVVLVIGFKVALHLALFL